MSRLSRTLQCATFGTESRISPPGFAARPDHPAKKVGRRWRMLEHVGRQHNVKPFAIHHECIVENAGMDSQPTRSRDFCPFGIGLDRNDVIAPVTVRDQRH